MLSTEVAPNNRQPSNWRCLVDLVSFRLPRGVLGSGSKRQSTPYDLLSKINHCNDTIRSFHHARGSLESRSFHHTALLVAAEQAPFNLAFFLGASPTPQIAQARIQSTDG